MKLNPAPLYLGRVAGIPVRAHYSWLPVFPFYAWAIAAGLLPREVPGLAWYEYWTFGVLTTALLVISVLAHELAHALMARVEGIGTGGVTLYMFGGLATLESQPANPSSEFKIAVAGPAASFLLGTLLFLADQLLLHGTTYLAPAQVLRHVGLVNWFLAGFNVLPGLPLDGGRMYRALLWKFSKNFRSATQMAVRSGILIAFTLILAGLYSFLYQDWVTGVWSVTIGLMIALLLGTSEGRTMGPWRVKRGTVEDVMKSDVVMVPPAMKVSEFVDTVLKNNHYTSFPVAQMRRLHGILLLEELKAVPRERWTQMTVAEAMRPVDSTTFMTSATSLEEAQRRLRSSGIGRAVVVDANGLIVGYVTLRDFEPA